MVVAVARVRVVQAPGDQVVDVVAVRNGVVPAARPVLVPGTGECFVAPVGVEVVDGQTVVVDVVPVGVVDVAVMEEVDVAFVDDRRVAAPGTMDVIVAL